MALSYIATTPEERYMLAALRRQGLTRHHCNAIARQLNTRPRGAARLSDAARMLQPVLVSVALQS